MLAKIVSIYINDYTKINRYIITSLGSYFTSILLIYLLSFLITEDNSIILSQTIKVFLIFFLVKYYTFQNYSFAKKQVPLYLLFVSIFKFFEAVLIYGVNLTTVPLEINVFFVLLISSIIKYFVFKRIFS